MLTIVQHDNKMKRGSFIHLFQFLCIQILSHSSIVGMLYQAGLFHKNMFVLFVKITYNFCNSIIFFLGIHNFVGRICFYLHLFSSTLASYSYYGTSFSGVSKLLVDYHLLIECIWLLLEADFAAPVIILIARFYVFSSFPRL